MRAPFESPSLHLPRSTLTPAERFAQPTFAKVAAGRAGRNQHAELMDIFCEYGGVRCSSSALNCVSRASHPRHAQLLLHRAGNRARVRKACPPNAPRRPPSSERFCAPFFDGNQRHKEAWIEWKWGSRPGVGNKLLQVG